MEEITATNLVDVVDIQFRPGQKVYFFDPAGLQLKQGDHVIIDTARGAEFGYCTAGNHRIPEKDVVAPLRSVLRIATPADEKIMRQNRDKEKRAYEVCMAKIAEQNLDMQLVSAEIAFDGSKILFFFTADERVDFRELVKNLASVFHTRIELRQIGVRDKAKMLGGLGICGLPFCCATFLDDFQPVSIKMAKTQNLSLNPTKISGTCGRLMCCLKYEQDAYEDLLRSAPKVESFVDTPEGRGTIVDVELLRQRVRVKLEDQPDTIVTVANSDIAVLRSGRAKKNDAPIPADLAPISGGGKAERKPEAPAQTALDSIKFRYSTETIAEEKPVAPVEQAEEVSAPKQEKTEGALRPAHRRTRKPRTGGEKPAEKAAASENAPQKPQKPVEKPIQKPRPVEKPQQNKKSEPPREGEGEEKKPNRRRPYRRYRGKKPQQGQS